MDENVGKQEESSNDLDSNELFFENNGDLMPEMDSNENVSLVFENQL